MANISRIRNTQLSLGGFSLKLELLRGRFLFNGVRLLRGYVSLISQGFHSDRSYSAYFCFTSVSPDKGKSDGFFAQTRATSRVFLFRAVHVSSNTQFSQGFRSDRSYSTYFCSQLLAQTRGTQLAFRSDKSYLAPFAFATRSSLSPMGYLEEMSMSVALGYLQLAAC